MFELREQLIALLFIVLGMLVTPLIFIALDYWAGIRKAKKRRDFNRKERRQEHLAVFFFCGKPVAIFLR
jgi:hypothetical protein